MEPVIKMEISGERVGIGAGKEMNALEGKFYGCEMLMENLSPPLLKV